MYYALLCVAALIFAVVLLVFAHICTYHAGLSHTVHAGEQLYFARLALVYGVLSFAATMAAGAAFVFATT